MTFINGARRALCAGVAALLAGCATNTITGRSQFMMVSEQHAISGSASAYRSMLSGFAKKGKVEKDTPRAKRVKEITDRLIAQAVRFRPDSATWNWQVEVIDEPKIVNAFCMAGGKMAIYTGFWEKLKATDDEVAAVMGHEIGHALASHTRERMSVAYASQGGALVLAALLSSRNDPGSFARNADQFSTAAALAITLPNSRESETEADRIGIELAARAGFDPRAAVTLWQKMKKDEKGYVPEFVSTHPSHDTRIQSLTEMIPKVDHLYQLAKAGKPTEGVPSFLQADNTVEKQAFAQKAAAEPETMSFVSAAFERFRRGEAVFDCRFACALAYGSHRGDWKEMHRRHAWRDLAISVMNVGYHGDLSYFLLGEAATHLGLKDAAPAYYRRALQAAKDGFGCAGGLGDTCEGFDVQRLSFAALNR